jgi:tRNA pseudouridine38-40 synthase
MPTRVSCTSPKMASYIVVIALLAYRTGFRWPQQRKVDRPPASFLIAGTSYLRLSDVNDVEQRIQCFWKTHPFRLAEGMVRSILIDGNVTGQLVLPGVQLPDACNGINYFSVLYVESLSHSIETIDVSYRISNLGTKKKRSFCLIIAYAGQHFCGWQRQPNNFVLPSVQEVIERAIESAFPENGRPDVRVSGRTDSGVHAVGQIARVRILAQRSGNDDATFITADEVFDALNTAAKSSYYTWRCLSVSATSGKFHPTFNSKSRSYVYVIDATPVSNLIISLQATRLDSDTEASQYSLLKDTKDFLNSLLVSLVGKQLDYYSFSYGKVTTETTICCLQHAFVRLGTVTQSQCNETIMIFEFTGNRFLRRMIRLLVGTSVSLAMHRLAKVSLINSTPGSYQTFEYPTLIEMCNLKDRTQRFVQTAPSGGLIFIGANVSAP